MIKAIFYFLLTGGSVILSAQEISGIWRGTLTQRPGGCFQVYNIELQIQVSGTTLSGASYHYSDFTNYVKEEFTGVYHSEKNSLLINEQKVITFNVPSDCIPCIKQYSLVYEKQNKKEILTGDWGGVVMNNVASCPPGKIILTRVTESDFDHIQEIKVDTGIIRLDFYDNAQIDGDTISVLLNNKPVISHQRLMAKPISMEIKIDLAHPEQEITMIGENLGDIPPNTALLIITAGPKRYRLYLASSEKKNAQVRFIYEKQTGKNKTATTEQ